MKVKYTPLWFQSMVACELLVQVPFFFLAIAAFIQRKEWIRIPCIIYSAHVSTTLVVILAEFIVPAINRNVEYDLKGLLQVYIPFLLLPLVIGVRWSFGGRPFGGRSRNIVGYRIVGGEIRDKNE